MQKNRRKEERFDKKIKKGIWCIDVEEAKWKKKKDIETFSGIICERIKLWKLLPMRPGYYKICYLYFFGYKNLAWGVDVPV